MCVCVGVGGGGGGGGCGCVCVCILKKKKKKKIFFFFFEIGNFFFKLGKKSPKSHWERGRISAPEDTKKNLWLH